MKEYFSKTKKDAEKTEVQVKKETEQYFSAVREFQSDKIKSMQTKTKLFQSISLVFAIVILMQAGALALMSPLKTAVPVMIRVDSVTGYTDAVLPLSNSKETYEEVVNKYFLSQYVINYESYDWETIQAMFDTVRIMSDSKTFSQYNTQVTSDNSPLNVLKQNNKIRVRVKSVTFLNPDTAQVRFDKVILNNDGTAANDYSQTSWVATIAFDYKKKINTEGERLLNPLGFQSLSYRVDPEAIK